MTFNEDVEDFPSAHFDAWPDTRALRDLNSVLAVTKDQILINMCLLLVLAYTMYCFGKASNHGESHAFLGAMAVLTTYAAIGAGFGVGVGLGIVFNPSTMIAIFLVLGIGIDDAFVIHGAYQQVDRRKCASVEEAVVEAVRVAGSSITVTSVTDVSAFIAGSFITIPALRTFCLFSALAVAADYAFQITAFVAWMTLDYKKAEAGGKDCCCSCCCCLPGAKRRVAAVAPLALEDGKAAAAAEPERPDFFGGRYADALLSPVGKVTVLLVTAALLVLGVVGCQNFKMDFDIQWFLTRDGPYGHIYDAIDLRDDHFSHQKLLPVRIFTKEGDYFGQKGDLARLIDRIEAEGGTKKSMMAINWFTQHELYDEAMAPASNSSAEWYASLHAFLDGPGHGFRDSIHFADDDGRILTTSIPVFWKFESDNAAAASGVRKMLKQREVVDDYGGAFGCILFMEVFVFFEGLAVAVRETVTSLCYAATAVFFVLIIMLANFQLAFLCLTVCVMESVCLLGAIHWYDDRLNSITAFFIIIAVGLSVDCSAHVAHTFAHAPGATRDDRTRAALATIGGSVFKGGLSTFFGICVTGFANSYIFWCFFKFLASIIGYAVYFGLVFVPVVLSVAGPMAEHRINIEPECDKT